MTRIGRPRLHSTTWSMKSSVPWSAQWRSSNTSTTVPLAAIRSKNVRHAANSSSRESAAAPSTPSRTSSADSIQRRSASSVTHGRRSRRASPGSSPRRRSRRGPRALRTISPSAQNVIPSPYAGERPGVPADRLDDAVEVLRELPQQAALARARDADDGHDAGAPLARPCAWNEVLEQPELAVAPDERRLEPVAAPAAAALGHDADRPERRHRRRLALEHLLARRLVRDRLVRRRARSTRRRAPCPAGRPTGAATAVLTMSPATIPWFVAPSVTAASPVSTPARALEPAAERPAPRRRGRAPRGPRVRRRSRGRSACPTRPSPRRR